jgi:methyl-accepting chemotaxis protein
MQTTTRLTWLIGAWLCCRRCSRSSAPAFAKLIVRPINSVTHGLEDIAQGEGDLTRNLEIRGATKPRSWPAGSTSSSAPFAA